MNALKVISQTFDNLKKIKLSFAHFPFLMLLNERE